MNVAVCDKNDIDREYASRLLQHYSTENSIDFTICEHINGNDLIYDIEDGAVFDIIFLGINSISLYGIGVAPKLRNLNYDGKIVFMADTSEYAVAGYDVDAAGYLLKPIHYKKLSGILDRNVRNFNTKTYQIKYRSAITRIPYNDILYVESKNTRCFIHCQNGETYIIYKRLTDIEAELNDNRFLRCHQSYLVNMDYIQSVDKNFVLGTGELILIRQRELKAIRQKYADYAEKKHTLCYLPDIYSGTSDMRIIR